MRRGVWLALGGAAWIGGCSWIPFFGDAGAPHLTNTAVQACRQKADDLGYDGTSERESAPLGDGRYTVVLEVRQHEGFGQIVCTYDPAKGADVPPLKLPEKPGEKPTEPAPMIAPAPTVTPAPPPGK